MILRLAKLPATVRGVYTVDGTPGRMPERCLYLSPDAAQSFAGELMHVVTVSDMFRSADSSLNAVRRNRGALPPGFSGHNYGFSIDLDIKATMQDWGCSAKYDLDARMEQAGWFCHRRDGRMASEAWHYNFLGVGETISNKVKTTSGYLEALVQRTYGQQFNLGFLESQTALQSLRMYSGALDGLAGPLTREAVRTFQRAYASSRIKETGKLDAATRRTLAFVTAGREVVPL